jgi:hypothetical protein
VSFGGEPVVSGGIVVSPYRRSQMPAAIAPATKSIAATTVRTEAISFGVMPGMGATIDAVSLKLIVVCD